MFKDNPLQVFLVKQQKRLDESRIWLTIVGAEQVKDFIIKRNRIDQLFLKGIDSQGTSLKDIGGSDLTSSGYSPFTLFSKQQKGARTTNITLFDTGEFYGSFIVIVDGNSFTIDADPIKDDTNLFREWGEDIIGLTDDSLQKLIDFLLIKYITYTREVIFKR